MPNLLGTAPNQVPTNADLGTMAFQDAGNYLDKTAGSGFGFKNRIINGAMMIDQRNAGASVTPANDQYVLDRYKITSYPNASKFTVQQNAGGVTPPAGFSKYLGITVTSAYTVGSTDVYVLEQMIEGQNVADLAFGTVNASPITLSFKVYSSVTGTFGGCITNATSTNVAYGFTYSIPVANTWTNISITIPGATTGTWLTTNGIGLSVRFGLGAGSAYAMSTSGSWVSGNWYSVAGTASILGTVGNTFYITGVQLEKGSTATSFDYRPYGTELALCQRYFWKYIRDAYAYEDMIPLNSCDLTSVARGRIFYPVSMRTPPSMSYAAVGNFAILTAAGGRNCTAVSFGGNGANTMNGYFEAASANIGTGQGLFFRANGQTTDTLSFSSEL